MLRSTGCQSAYGWAVAGGASGEGLTVARAGYAEEWKFPIVDRLETYVLARAAA